MRRETGSNTLLQTDRSNLIVLLICSLFWVSVLFSLYVYVVAFLDLATISQISKHLVSKVSFGSAFRKRNRLMGQSRSREDDSKQTCYYIYELQSKIVLVNDLRV